MGLLVKVLEGVALGIGIVMGFYLFSNIGFLGIGDFITLVAEKIGGVFSGIGG